eukprot:TRINITY_DN4455_c0_g1_i3.p1 TRINITY_DN4455_c0_g1~~TRINITY_DN4455_c0_g1_i3.p1  ORF type:complete len:636 (+),score=104.38 TRINITY_DN4455_c0_g1_i3:29-1909(+)
MNQNSLAMVNFFGNELMKSPFYDAANGTIDEFLSISASDRTDDGRIYSCSSFKLQGSETIVTISPTYFNYRQCQCSKGYVGYPPDDCYQCPENCDCSGDVISWKKGYYPIYASNDNGTSYVYGCQKCDEISFDNPHCNPNGNCAAKLYEPSPNCTLCNVGSEGRLCTKCQCDSTSDCYFLNTGHCTKCDSPKNIALYFIPVIVVFLVSVGVAIFSLSYKKKGESLFSRVTKRMSKLYRCVSSGHLKITLVFLQSISAINNMWEIVIMVKLAPVLGITNLSTTGFGLVCMMPFMAEPDNDMIVVSILPLVVILIGVVCAVIATYACRTDSSTNRKSIRRRSSLRLSTNSSIHDEFMKVGEYEPKVWERIASIVITSLYFFYFTLASSALSVWNCPTEEGSGKRYMQKYPWLERSEETEWKHLRIISIIDLVFYVFGIPIFFAVLLMVFRKRSKEQSVRYWLGDTLYRAYRPQMFMFELVIMTRRLALAALVSVFEKGSVFQVSGIYTVLLTSLLIQNHIQPFNTYIENKMEELGLVTLIFSYAAQLASLAEIAENRHDFLAITTVTMNGIVALLMIVTLFRSSLLRVIELKKKQEAKENIEIESLIGSESWRDDVDDEKITELKADD